MVNSCFFHLRFLDNELMIAVALNYFEGSEFDLDAYNLGKRIDYFARAFQFVC